MPHLRTWQGGGAASDTAPSPPPGHAHLPCQVRAPWHHPHLSRHQPSQLHWTTTRSWVSCGPRPQHLARGTQKKKQIPSKATYRVCSHAARAHSRSRQTSQRGGFDWNRCFCVIWQKLPAASWHNAPQTEAFLSDESTGKQLATLLHFVRVRGYGEHKDAYV